MKSLHTFEELEAWKAARELRKLIASIAKQFPPQEKYRLADQILRSSRSVAANIAEGFGRYHHQENIQFCRQARGSLTETMEHIICTFDEGFIDEQLLGECRQRVDYCTKVLNGYIAYLQKAKQKTINEMSY